MEALKKFGFRSSELKAELFLQEGKMIRMGFPPMRIELLTRISGVAFQECYADRIVDQIDDLENLP